MSTGSRLLAFTAMSGVSTRQMKSGARLLAFIEMSGVSTRHRRSGARLLAFSAKSGVSTRHRRSGARLLALTAFALLTFTAKSQEIRNVTSEQDGNSINIYYDIAGARTFQSFTISASCETGSRKFKLKSVTGDVGENVQGSARKKIVWDVFKDVDSLSEAKFTVRIERIADSRPKDAQHKRSDAVFLRKGIEVLAEGGGSFAGGKLGGQFSLIGGFNIAPGILAGIGLGVMGQGLEVTDVDIDRPSGAPNYNMSNETDSFLNTRNTWKAGSMVAVPLFIHLRYAFSDKKVGPYAFVNLGTLATGSMDFTSTLATNPHYDTLALYSGGGNQYVSTGQHGNTGENVVANASFTKSFFWTIGIGVNNQLSAKWALCLEASYNMYSYTFDIERKFYHYTYGYLDPPDANGTVYNTVLYYKSREQKSENATISKTLGTVNVKVGLVYSF